MTPEQEALRGEAASRLLADELIRELFDEIRQDRLNMIAMTAPEQSKHREEAYFEIRGIDTLLTKLKAVADGGIYARKRLGRS